MAQLILAVADVYGYMSIAYRLCVCRAYCVRVLWLLMRFGYRLDVVLMIYIMRDVMCDRVPLQRGAATRHV